MLRLSNYERETIINFNEGENAASVYTHNKALRHRLKQLAQEHPEDCRLFRTVHRDQAVEYYIPKAWIKIHPTRKISDAQREALKKARIALKMPAHAESQEREASREGKDTTQPKEGTKP